MKKRNICRFFDEKRIAKGNPSTELSAYRRLTYLNLRAHPTSKAAR